MEQNNDRLSKEDIAALSADELSEHLIEDKEFPVREVETLEDRKIDGRHFLQLSRQDIAILFPKSEQFIFGMDLYKYIEELNMPSTTSKNVSDRPSSKQGISKQTTPVSDAINSRKASQGSNPLNPGQTNNVPASNSLKAVAQKRSFSSLPPGFALPSYEPDIEQAIKCDSFYNPYKHAKLIRKSCEALAGYCRENEMPVTTELRSHLATALVQLAPKSLSDDGKSADDGMKTQVNKWFYNNGFQIRVSTGVVKRRKMNPDSDGNASTSSDDKAAVEHHLKELESECKKKKKDLYKCFKLMALTAERRREWFITMKAPTRIPFTLNLFSVLKEPEMIFNDFLKFSQGKSVERFEQAKTKMATLVSSLIETIVPAVIKYGRMNTKLKLPSNEELSESGKTMLMLRIALIQLKCCNKDKVDDMMKYIVYMSEEPDVASLDFTRTHTSPFLCIQGTENDIRQMVIIGEKKVLTNNMARRSIAEGLLILISSYYAYQLEFPKNVGAVMTFLARRMGNAPFEKNPTTVFTNFVRVINRIVEESKELDNDEARDASDDDNSEPEE